MSESDRSGGVRRVIACAIMAAALAGLGACGGSGRVDGDAPLEAPPFEVLADQPPPEAIERAREAAAALGGALLARLSDELDRGGPEEALRVCSRVAPEIAREQSGGGLSVRRVSLRVRNPADRPDAYERDKLRELERLHGEGRGTTASAEVVRADGKRSLRFMKPVLVGDACLTCHGTREEIDPAVIRVLDERYPEDEAIGYSAGEFRGAISVTVDLDG